MTLRPRIDIPYEPIAAFCQRNRIRRLSLFGSVLRDDFNDESDIDVLVEFEPGVGVGYFEFMRMQFELRDMLGREVDLNTRDDLSQCLRDGVVRKAWHIYEHA